MRYIIYYSLGSILFLLINIIVYFTKKVIPDKKTKIYKWMLIMALVSVIFDVLSAIIDGNLAIPIWVSYLTNSLFLLGMHTCLVLFVNYLLIFINNRIIPHKQFILSIPFFFVCFGILLSFVSKYGIFYIDSEHIYRAGKIHILVYIVTIIYLLTSVYILFIKGKVIRTITKIALAVSIILVLSMTLIQMKNPIYLLTASATALGITIMYYVVQLPSQYLDPNTKTYNRVAMMPLLNEVDNKKEFTTILISVYPSLNANYFQGSLKDEYIINNVGLKLSQIFTRGYVCHLYYTDYVLILKDEENKTSKQNDNLINNYLNQIKEIPLTCIVDGMTVEYQLGVTVLESKYLHKQIDIMNFFDYLIYTNQNKTLLPKIIQEDDIKAYLQKVNMSNNLKELLEQNKFNLKVQEIKGIDGTIVGCEILFYIDKVASSYEDIISGAIDSDCCDLLLKTVMSLMASKQAELSKYPYLVVKCPTFFLNIPSFFNFIDLYLKPMKINFCYMIDEKEYAKMSKETQGIMKSLHEKGYQIILDNFGTGYTNNNTLFYLELFAVRVNINQLKKTMDDNTLVTFLRIIHTITKQIDTHFMCTGITNDKEIAILKSAGVNYYQEIK